MPQLERVVLDVPTHSIDMTIFVLTPYGSLNPLVTLVPSHARLCNRKHLALTNKMKPIGEKNKIGNQNSW